MKKIVAAIPFAFVIAACAVDPSTPEDHMKIYETCLKTQCQEAQESGNEACDACTSACLNASYDCDPSSACDSSCSPRDCSDYNDTCADEGYKVIEANNPSDDVNTACNNELTAIANCGYSVSTTSSDCARYASSELPANATYYQCVANLPCASMTDANAIAACSPAPNTLGDDFCASLVSACPSNGCSTSGQASLDADGPWLRQDAIDALQSCLSQPSCDESVECLTAWRDAVE